MSDLDQYLTWKKKMQGQHRLSYTSYKIDEETDHVPVPTWADLDYFYVFANEHFTIAWKRENNQIVFKEKLPRGSIVRVIHPHASIEAVGQDIQEREEIWEKMKQEPKQDGKSQQQ